MINESYYFSKINNIDVAKIIVNNDIFYEVLKTEDYEYCKKIINKTNKNNLEILFCNKVADLNIINTHEFSLA